MTAVEQATGGRDLDLGAERVWPPAQVVLHEGWRCRLDRGVTRRANSVLAAKWTGTDLDSSLDFVENLYKDHSLTPCFQITTSAKPLDLDERLHARGYGRGGLSLVQRRQLSAAQAETGARDPELSLTSTPGAPWRAVLRASGGPAQAEAKSAILARVVGPAAFVALRPTGAPPSDAAAIGVGVRDGATVWINSMFTTPACRGQGLARRLLQAIAGWALRQGAEALLLQVECDNRPARRLYEGFGFATLYPYHYRSLARTQAGAGGC